MIWWTSQVHRVVYATSLEPTRIVPFISEKSEDASFAWEKIEE
jgi:hypothetical protein